jgi:hypothetical protein
MVRSGSITRKKALVRISAFPELTLLLLLVFARAAVAAPGLYERSHVNPLMAHQNHRGAVSNARLSKVKAAPLVHVALVQHFDIFQCFRK